VVRSSYLLSLLLLAGCSVAEPPASTGGTDAPPGVCGRRLVRVRPDDTTTHVSLVAAQGRGWWSSSRPDGRGGPGAARGRGGGAGPRMSERLGAEGG